ncbi:unnamed protein product [Porites lobata]|uniref:Uncharacterized protein n=1 Tax=Porites lobata TaxID=104759 RepID=A0ABN8Q7B0_9CNID|nr:unnamed protein product [Porites lobata]
MVMRTIMKNERMHDHLSRNDHITWQFNLSGSSCSVGLEEVILERGTNFVGGERELRESLEKWKRHQIEHKQLQGGFLWKDRSVLSKKVEAGAISGVSVLEEVVATVSSIISNVDAVDLGSDLPKFLESFLQKVEAILQDVEEQNLDAGVLAEVVDQTISLIQTLQEPGNSLSLLFCFCFRANNYCVRSELTSDNGLSISCLGYPRASRHCLNFARHSSNIVFEEFVRSNLIAPPLMKPLGWHEAKCVY